MADTGGIISNDGPNMLYLLLKIINPATTIGVSNLQYKIEKSNLAKFGNNVKDLLDEIYPNYSIIKEKGERHEDYVRHMFRDLVAT